MAECWYLGLLGGYHLVASLGRNGRLLLVG